MIHGTARQSSLSIEQEGQKEFLPWFSGTKRQAKVSKRQTSPKTVKDQQKILDFVRLDVDWDQIGFVIIYLQTEAAAKRCSKSFRYNN
jgi:hypothetical protein